MRIIILILIVYIVVATLWLPLQAGEKTSTTEVMSKLGELIKNQQTILQKLDEMKEELKIIKIRATR